MTSREHHTLRECSLGFRGYMTSHESHEYLIMELDTMVSHSVLLEIPRLSKAVNKSPLIPLCLLGKS